MLRLPFMMVLSVLSCLLLLSSNAAAIQYCDSERVDALYKELMGVVPEADRAFLEKSQQLWRESARADGVCVEDEYGGGTLADSARARHFLALCQGRCDFLENLVLEYRAGLPAFRRGMKILCREGIVSEGFQAFSLKEHSGEETLAALKAEIELQKKALHKYHKREFANLKKGYTGYDLEMRTAHLNKAHDKWVESLQADMQLEQRNPAGTLGEIDACLLELNQLVERIRFFQQQ